MKSRLRMKNLREQTHSLSLTLSLCDLIVDAERWGCGLMNGNMKMDEYGHDISTDGRDNKCVVLFRIN